MGFLKFQLTAAISASPGKISKGYDIPTMAKYMDAIHLMAYDLHGSWEKTADHHSPLYARYSDLITFKDKAICSEIFRIPTGETRWLWNSFGILQ